MQDSGFFLRARKPLLRRRERARGESAGPARSIAHASAGRQGPGRAHRSFCLVVLNAPFIIG
jgi:hypothetical protein